jgi:hypothetical protein
VQRRTVLLVLMLSGCKVANVLPGGSAPQRAIESGVVRALGLRADFDRYVTRHRQLEAAEARGDQQAAVLLRAALNAVLEESQKSRGAYNDQLLRTAKEYTADTIKQALEAVVARYEADGATSLVPIARLFVEHVLSYQGSGSADFDKLHEELLK